MCIPYFFIDNWKMSIEEWANKGFRIGIFPVLHLNKHEWTAGVRIGNESKMTWLSKKDEGCTFSSFTSYTNALNAILDFCENYKPKRKRNG